MHILKKVLAGTMVLSFALSLHTDALHAENGNKETTKEESLVVLAQSANNSAKVLSTFLKGTEFIASGNSGSWINATYEGDGSRIGEDFVSELAVAVNSKTEIKEIAIVNTDVLNIRKEASTSSPVTGQLKRGEKVGILGSSGNWRKIKTSGGTVGWVYYEYLSDKAAESTASTLAATAAQESKKTAATGTAYVTADVLNLRSDASTAASIKGKLKQGEKVSVLGTSGDWTKVKTSGGTTGWVYSEYITNKAPVTSRGTAATRTDKASDSLSKGEKIVEYAKKFLGVPYIWGGTTPKGFDCSGLVYYVYKQFGINLPRTSKEQATKGTTVSKSDLKPGDLMFFDTSGANNGVVTHVGIYIGNGKFIHASNPKSDVKITNVNDSFYVKAYIKSKRVL
ncbi:SH3 domain-containing C40 family peptidase [Clostridium thermosuccinogenes]|uniref:C40 family peptidase n=1 Tax=Clostridium thermosuccinogenes TaxID=84032 RepID=UPI000CCC3FA7|nr:SH3 domain-containing C40 family peptidase [Pseudoclostridium thermosuccinogenes]PNT92672.1 hypothetical protein CDQ83_03660 [Pseudoclostridium thermosuccinogenes]